jgi:uncharacterized protein (TIGR02391 family)
VELIEKLNFIKQFIIEDENDEEVQTNSLLLSDFHPIVKQTAGKLFIGGHYRQAILDTYIELVQSVKVKSAKYDIEGSSLMQTVFSANKPFLSISENADEQLGFMWLFSGAVMGIRNVKAHKVDEHPDKQTTLEYLGFPSLLFKVLDDSQAVKNP